MAVNISEHFRTSSNLFKLFNLNRQSGAGESVSSPPAACEGTLFDLKNSPLNISNEHLESLGRCSRCSGCAQIFLGVRNCPLLSKNQNVQNVFLNAKKHLEQFELSHPQNGPF